MKRIISVFLIIFVFIFNCFPVFALDEFVVENFQNMEFHYNYIENLNANIDAFEYAYYIKVFNGNDGSYPGIFFYSNYLLEIIVDTDNHDHLIQVHNSNENNVEFFICKFGNDFEWKTVNSNSFIYYDTQYTFVDSQLLIQNSDCVSEKYCSPDVYVPIVSDDYEEDGVVIKGLTAFFNKMTSALNDILETIKGIVDSIIGIPEEGYFASKIETIKESINAKYNLDALFGFFEDMKNIESTVPNFSFDKDLTINGQTFPFDFYIDFSWFDGEIKNIIFLLFRAVGYPLLIVYNLNQVYLLFRGRKFISEDGGEDA